MVLGRRVGLRGFNRSPILLELCWLKSPRRKSCTKCGRRRKIQDFGRDNKSADGFQSWCKHCKHEAGAKTRYGLSREDYLTLHETSGGCEICRQKPRSRRLAIDHCHDSGKVRGLLCDACNLGLGKFEDSPELLRRAADYLERAR